ncbi:MAG TPA: hypothetical protein VF544_14080 [Pyrinomonadaceae bacterium]|jgi:hypothetical protein
MKTNGTFDWGEASEASDTIKRFTKDKDLTQDSEAQTRFDVIDRMVKEVLGWTYGQISVEERDDGEKRGYVDYIFRSGDYVIVLEAKKIGAAFPSPTRRKALKMSGSVLGSGEIAEAITQARRYASSKDAKIALVSNGFCWCYFSPGDEIEDAYAGLLFPFDMDSDAEQLFNLFSAKKVENGSLEDISTINPPRHENRLLSEMMDAAARVDRNNIADHIAPALSKAFYDAALLSDPNALEWCFVKTEARTKFDQTLGVYLVDPKPDTVKPAKRIKKRHERGHLHSLIDTSSVGFAPPVTLIIGSVGSGKSTYLKHFELITGKELLAAKKVHWIYIDFEEMGRGGNPRAFLYKKLRDYLSSNHPDNPTDYRNVIEPAYKEEIAGLARGPYSLIASDKDQFNLKITDLIAKDYLDVEPYVDKVFKFVTSSNMCIVVLDNIDLYEDDLLETTVFSEGLAFSKRAQCNVIVSIRDKTYVRHRNSSAFDAFELRKLWLDPPPFKSVLSRRMSLSKKILEKKQANIELSTGARLNVPDLSVFFDIVQKSVLSGGSGDFIEAMADENIRKGLSLIRNFLTSGHIQADKAVGNYLKGDEGYEFPFHETFKGTMLGQWKYFKEERAECINVFDSKLGSKNLRLLRLYILKYLLLNAQDENEVEVPVSGCIKLFSRAGASEDQLLLCLNDLADNGLIRSITAEDIHPNSTIAITRRGAYLSKLLTKKFVYVEECMYDTAIEDKNVWQELAALTANIEAEVKRGAPIQMPLRRTRIEFFLNYLQDLESRFLQLLGDGDILAVMAHIKSQVIREAGIAASKAIRFS